MKKTNEEKMTYKPLFGEALEKRKAYQRAYRKKHKEEINAKTRAKRHALGEKFREERRKYWAEHKGQLNEHRRKYYAKNKIKIKAQKKITRAKRRKQANEDVKRRRREYYGDAHKQVLRAVINGKLIKQSCEVCGCMETQAHHDDYNKPLEVRWLCDICHKKWHQDNKPIYIRREDKK